MGKIKIYNCDLFLGIRKRGTQSDCAKRLKKKGHNRMTRIRINKIISGRLKPTIEEKRLLANYVRRSQKYLFGSK